MKEVSKLVDTQWMYGIAFINNTVENWSNPFEVAQYVEEQLAGNLLGLQVSSPHPCFVYAHVFRVSSLTCLLCRGV